jgi:hypothetical protein
MGLFKSISAVFRTHSQRFSGTSAKPWLIVNQDGIDRVNRPVISIGAVGSLQRGQCFYFYHSLRENSEDELRDDRIGPGDLYCRVATTSKDLWRPELVFVWGRSQELGTIPLALERLEAPLELSEDPREGLISVPIRRVAPGKRDTVVRRLLVILVTYDAPYAGTDDPLWLRVQTAEGVATHEMITDTPQTDLEINSANAYELPVERPFTRADLMAEGAEVRLGIHGSDKWVPKKIFIMGLDQPRGRPERVVPLVRAHDPGPLSADPTEGAPSLRLPLDEVD